jgi:hypothetical protein
MFYDRMDPTRYATLRGANWRPDEISAKPICIGKNALPGNSFGRSSGIMEALLQ